MTEQRPEEMPAATPEPTSAPEGVLDEADLEAEAALDANSAEAKATEHLADLQRLQAEYVNYRKRVERDRGAVIDLAVARVVEALVPVLDDIAAARDHEELEGPFAAIADKLEATLERLGLVTYGAVEEPFDPTVHEALTSTTEADLTIPVVREVSQAGYRLGDRVLRPARVVVAQPE
ncbi:MAG: nucleotide exchange factor GrpE [Demequinaceae bacterium]|nr:nucleotide exchange factor GrpE [Demequinaceae bacterium]